MKESINLTIEEKHLVVDLVYKLTTVDVTKVIIDENDKHMLRNVLLKVVNTIHEN